MTDVRAPRAIDGEPDTIDEAAAAIDAEASGIGGRRALGLAIVGLAVAGVAISLYLTITKLAGELPVCGPLRGCDTVALSEYSTMFGLPTALYGAGLSAAVAVLGGWWWRTGDRRAALGLYGFGLAGVFVVAYLTYLELFVIHAVCVWCVIYGVTVVAGFLAAMLALRRSPPPG